MSYKVVLSVGLVCGVWLSSGATSGQPVASTELPHEEVTLEEFWEAADDKASPPSRPSEPQRPHPFSVSSGPLRQPPASIADIPFCRPTGTPAEFVIRTQQEYDSFIRSSYAKSYDSLQYHLTKYPQSYASTPQLTFEEFFKRCNTFPEIDFSQKTFLGRSAGGGGCHVDFKKHVFRDDEDKTIQYVVSVIESGGCDKGFGSGNWITIPKIPPEYRVTFDVEKTAADSQL